MSLNAPVLQNQLPKSLHLLLGESPIQENVVAFLDEISMWYSKHICIFLIEPIDK